MTLSTVWNCDIGTPQFGYRHAQQPSFEDEAVANGHGLKLWARATDFLLHGSVIFSQRTAWLRIILKKFSL